ncbi:MAG: hypothetical protein J7L15_02995 [Clostridiales bacterium]|nr:hypothetical protein [Clostridiales bacterium]
MKKGLVLPGYFAVAFVWFTTHFGGGFASGAQATSFFVQYGWYSLFTPVLAILIDTLIFYYVWDFSVIHEKYEYRSWCDEFYKPAQGLFSNLYEIVFNFILVIATAVAFATGGATLESVIGTPYILNTLFIASIMFILTIYGADLVRSAASYIAIFVIAGLIIVYGANFIATFPNIARVISEAPAPKGLWPAIWSAIKYASFQAAVIGSYIAVSDVLGSREDAKKAAIWGAVINGGLLLLATLVILGYYPAIITEKVPILYVISNGVGGRAAELFVSLLIFLGVISTGVNLIYGGTKRIVTVWTKNSKNKDEKSKSIIASAVYVVITWGIALFGLLPLIAKGYGYIGYIALPVVVFPVLYKGITKKGWFKEGSKEDKAIN